MIRSFLLLAGSLVAGAPLVAAAQHRPHDAARPGSTRESRYNGPLAAYDRLTERVDRKNAKAHEYQRDTPGIRDWKRRQRYSEAMDSDDGDD